MDCASKLTPSTADTGIHRPHDSVQQSQVHRRTTYYSSCLPAPLTTATAPLTTATAPLTTATAPLTTAAATLITATAPLTTATPPLTTATVPLTKAATPLVQCSPDVGDWVADRRGEQQRVVTQRVAQLHKGLACRGGGGAHAGIMGTTCACLKNMWVHMGTTCACLKDMGVHMGTTCTVYLSRCLSPAEAQWWRRA